MSRICIAIVGLFLWTSSYSKLNEHYYAPYKRVLSVSKDLDERINALSHLIFEENADLNKAFSVTKQYVNTGNQYKLGKELQIQKTIYFAQQNRIPLARATLDSAISLSTKQDPLLNLLQCILSDEEPSNNPKLYLEKYESYLFSESSGRENRYKQYILNALIDDLVDEDDTVLKYLEIAVYLANGVNDNPNLNIASNFLLMRKFMNLGEYYSAIEMLLSMEPEVLQYGSTEDSLNLFDWLGFGYSRVNELYLAKKYVEKSLIYSTGDTPRTAKLFSNLGFLYLASGKLDTATYFLNKAEVLLNEEADSSYLNSIYLGFTEYYLRIGDTSIAQYYLNKALNWAGQNDLSLCYSYSFCSKLNANDPLVALSFINRSLAYANKSDDMLDVVEMLLAKKRDIHLILGEPKQADSSEQALKKIAKQLDLDKIKSDFNFKKTRSILAKIDAQRNEYQEKLEKQSKNSLIRTLLLGATSLFVLVLLTFFLYKIQRRNKNYSAKVIEYKNKLQAVAEQTESLVRENTALIKTEVSQELHDNILSALSGLCIMSEVTLSRNLKHKGRDIETLEKMHNALKVSYKDIENYIDSLRFDIPIATSIKSIAELEPYTKDVLSPLGINSLVTITSDDTTEVLCQKKAFEIIRITKELINNVIKHADATLVTLRMEIKDGVLTLSCLDNGKGFDVTKTSNRGLKNIKERVKKLHGEIDITSNEGVGTFVQITCSV